jgi:hypothetical protein
MNVKYFAILFIVLCSSLGASEKNIALLVRRGWIGEVVFAYRIKTACTNIHWKADVIHVLKEKDLKKNKYDFVINLTPYVYKHLECQNYLAIFHPEHHYFNMEGFLKEEYCGYDGYLLTYSPGALDTERDFANKLKFPYIQWYPTVPRRAFQIVEPSHLFHICCRWGDRFESEKFQKCLSMLDNQPYTRFYGHRLFRALYPQSYQGEIQLDCDSLHLASQAGISLVFHSAAHNAYGLPSGRIFEAAAASTVIICDQNSFVKDNFGDSVLYINTDGDAASIYDQIQLHMDWIALNKTEALEKAKQAHEIYEKKFVLEDQLIRLGKFHDLLLQAK